eukprot:TRINITY_DN124003_c0_g1_i1.p1 TRINITY_DN124003_c0_g1~~TRINITY_DN124003_c0_g1_i1.p1  ORF type:complete len:159 (-),score=14.91 TRINITY_DN124003_c0_g1_i1:165-641(-)
MALIASLVSFDMKKVIDGYETQEEPVYESVPVRVLRRKGRCVQRTLSGALCQFPFDYCPLFSSCSRQTSCTRRGDGSLWCATSVRWDKSYRTWDYCSSHQSCEEDEYDTITERRMVDKVQRKFPIYSHRALPDGVDQKALTNALEMVASSEAQLVLQR